MFSAQTDWIVTNRLAWNIAYVAHLGDIVDTGDSLSQWQNATNALYRLENPLTTGLPTAFPTARRGNHDQDPNEDPSGASTASTTSSSAFPLRRPHLLRGYYGTNNDSHFDLFSGGGLDFIALHLEYDGNADPAVLAWANALLQTYSERRPSS